MLQSLDLFDLSKKVLSQEDADFLGFKSLMEKFDDAIFQTLEAHF